MNELKVFENAEFGSVRTVEENGKVLFCGSDVAKALGYSNVSDALKRHCRAIVKHDTPISGKMQAINFIPEGDVYRLITHSKLPSAEKFESWVFDEVLPSIRKTGSYQKPMSQLEMIAQMAQASVELEKKQSQQAVELQHTNKRLDNIGEVIALDTTSWRKDAHRIITKIATKLGGFDHIKDVNTEINRLVDSRGGVSLSTRLTNKRQRMALEGVCKSKRDKLTKVDIIADDKKLIEIYIAIVKEMAVKYGVTL